MSNELIEVDFDYVVASSTDATCLSIGGENVWLPKSQATITRVNGNDGSGSVELPEWLAIKKELI